MGQTVAFSLPRIASATAVFAGLWWLITRGRPDAWQIIGNTAEDVLRQSQTAVLAVKPDSFVSPVQ